MPRFAANLSFMYTEVPFLERFALAAEDGFAAVEWLFPTGLDLNAVAARLRTHQLQQVLFNCAPGDWESGERGLAALPGRELQCQALFAQAIEAARILHCPRIHLLAGIAPAGADRVRMRETYVTNLRAAAQAARAAGLMITIEPINPRDIPGYFLNTQAEARAIVTEVGADNLHVQMDLYHCQIVEGELATRIRDQMPLIGHMQIAGVPGRHEPDDGEINYPYLFRLIDELGYQGWIGCEYRPRSGTRAGLGWLKTLRGH